MFNLFGSAWNQGRRTYAAVRGKNGDGNGNGNNNGSGNGYGGNPSTSTLGGGFGEATARELDTVVGEMKASDCYHLLREHHAQVGEGGSGSGGGIAEPR